MKVVEIAFRCYPVLDLVRARRFCEGVPGLKPTYYDPDGKALCIHKRNAGHH